MLLLHSRASLTVDDRSYGGKIDTPQAQGTKRADGLPKTSDDIR